MSHPWFSDQPHVGVGRSDGHELKTIRSDGGQLMTAKSHDPIAKKKAVQTGLLSRRWRNLWRGVRAVDIDVRELRVEGPNGPYFDRDRIEDLADAILSPGPLPGAARELDALRLHLHEDALAANFQRWIRRALRRRPASIDITYVVRTCISWPPPVTLTPPAAASRIKTLRLYGLRPTIAFGALEFPALEDLHIEKCAYPHGSIALPTLKRFALISPINGSFIREQHLTAPRLTSLRLVLPYNRVHGGVRVLADAPLVSLVDASISIFDTDPVDQRNRRPNQIQVDFFVSVSNLIGRLTSASNLDLSGFPAMALLDTKSQEMSMFPHLTSLLLDECDIGNKYHVLNSILQNAQNLEQLKLHNCKFVGKSRRKMGKPKSKEKTSRCSSSTSPSFVCNSLKSVEIKYPRDDVPSHDFLYEFQKETPANQWRKRSIDNEETALVELQRKWNKGDAKYEA
uniref:FBD domain-containing protein n=1 Tax=Oryza brachyantha TaxID=4533 RepID=J3LYN6_ORYBR